jgi:hypothetical protein
MPALLQPDHRTGEALHVTAHIGRYPLEDYVTRVETGLVPQPGGALSKERAAVLDTQLRQLHRARRIAALELRNWTPTTDPEGHCR